MDRQQAKKMSKMIKNICIMDAMQAEAMLRIALGIFVSVCLGTASLPKIVPSSLKFLVGILGISFSMTNTKLLYSLGQVLPATISTVVVALMVCSALFAAATVSDGLLVAAYVIMCFFVSLFWFGKIWTASGGLASTFMVMGGMLASTFRPLIQNGISLTLAENISGNITASTDPLALDLLANLCLEQQSVSLIDCAIANITASATLTLPDGVSDQIKSLAGQPFIVILENDTITGTVPGGMWIVKAFWTERGLDNPLALASTLLIAMLWGFTGWFVATLLPFPRTLRGVLSRIAVPNTLSQISEMVGLHKGPEKVNNVRELLAASLAGIQGGGQAKAIVFEPRICKAPFEYTVPQLKELMVQTEFAALASVKFWGMATTEETRCSVDPQELATIDKSAALLSSSAKVLESGGADEDVAALKTLRRSSAPPTDEEITTSITIKNDDLFYHRSEMVADATLTWIKAMKSPPKLSAKERFSNFVKNFAPWLIVPTAPLLMFLDGFNTLIHPKRYSILRVLWITRVIVGYLALFCMTIYWDAFTLFRIKTTEIGLGAVFHGWCFSAYGASLRCTMEGTVKQGVQRMLGTVVGGFWAWLGVIVVSGSTDDTDPMNTYGFVAWVTIFSILSARVGMEKGMGALMSIGNDFGAVSNFVATVHALIMFEVFVGKGSKADLVYNRILGNLVGILMAIILAATPPYLRGGDPAHARKYLGAIRESLNNLLKDIADNNVGWDRKSLTRDYLQNPSERRQAANYLLKDSGSLQVIKFLRPDPRLKPLLDELLITESLFSNLVQAFKKVKEDYPEETWDTLCNSVRRFIDDPRKHTEEPVDVDKEEEVRHNYFVLWIETLHQRMEQHDVVFSELPESSNFWNIQDDFHVPSFTPFQRRSSGQLPGDEASE